MSPVELMLTRRLKYVFDKLFPSLKSRTVNKYDTKHSRSAIKYTLQHEMMAKKNMGKQHNSRYNRKIVHDERKEKQNKRQ